MRLFGIRATSVTMGLGLFAATLGVLGAGSSGPAAVRYELDAPLLATGGRVFACFSDDLMNTGCGGIEVKGVDVSQIPEGGGNPPWSPMMRLVGTWDGQALTVTEAPQVAQRPPGLPPLCTQDVNAQPEPDSMQGQIEVIRALQSRGADVLESNGCDHATVGVLVVVADDATVDWMTKHYRVNVVSWMRRLPSGP
jgi:hypothetical protein